MKDFWKLCSRFLSEIQPMLKVVSGIISKEWSHCHWITHYYLALMFSSSSGFWTHGGCNKYSMLPIECLIYQGNPLRSSATKNDGLYWDTFLILPKGIHNWTVFTRSTKSWIWMCCFSWSSFLPVSLSQPRCYNFIWNVNFIFQTCIYIQKENQE